MERFSGICKKISPLRDDSVKDKLDTESGSGLYLIKNMYLVWADPPRR
jgi:hypothetical protein